MSQASYHLEGSSDGTWSVIDATTSRPATARDRVLERLSAREAQDVLNLMIWVDKLRPQRVLEKA